MPKLIFVNRFYHPDLSATSQLLTDAAEFLARSHDVHIVTSRLSYEGVDQYSPYQEVANVKIHRVWTTSFGRVNLIGRALDYLTFYAGAFIKLLKLAAPGDVLIAKTDPPMLSIPVSWAAKLKGARLANWLQDLFPEIALALGVKLPPILTNLLFRLRNSSLKTASLNLVIGEMMRSRIIRTGISAQHSVVVPNWSDGDLIVPVESEQLRRDWSLENKFIVSYSGNFGRAHDFDTLSKGIEMLDSDDSIAFLMVGGGVSMKRLQSIEYKSVVYKPYQPRDRLPQSLTLPDLHLISLLPKLEGLVLPSKLYGILAAGKPIINIGDSEGEVGTLISRYDIGFNVSVGDVEEFVRVIKYSRDNPAALKRKGLASRQLFDSQFGAKRSLRKLEEALCSIIL
ncbi:MAG: glycosyltransferase family 4 protein [Pseudomonadales bacterium]|nr:glycosyltransferase family 4 protein [Pseudomonadales bacterium]MBO6596000.1 glycosyltransferase family 4 protein [Pseudomonadales bacterium]MBO6822483.1 glycosyltransferase family 4 protein [Pseudomonadales bacterium]